MAEENPPPLPLSARLEALLFAAPEPVAISQLAAALEVTARKVEKGLEELDALYRDPQQPRGLRLQRLHGRAQLTTAPEAAALVEHFLGLEATSRLSRAALEVLAVVAYRRPVTRPQIDAIRGVNSDSALKSLLNKGLLQEVGRSAGPGRPFLFSVTPEFLGHFGLSSLDELPPLDLEAQQENGSQPEEEILKT